uniref:Uncharacterized protein n=1 Tax=Yoonia rhodophyticola TaxID=3137370 RepID=A0AAN0MC01_9RHOB
MTLILDHIHFLPDNIAAHILRALLWGVVRTWIIRVGLSGHAKRRNQC